jgi:NIPSNAP
MYLHATLIPKVGHGPMLAESLTKLTAATESPDMRLVAALSTMSGVPGEVVHLWKLTDANALVSMLERAREHPSYQASVDRLGEHLSGERQRLVVDAGYAPEAKLSTLGSEARYFQARLTVGYGQAERIGELVAGLRDVLEPTAGWRLVAAYRTVIGDHDELIDLWEIPAGEPFEEALARAAEVPEFVEVAAQLPKYLIAEETRLMRPTAYCPTVA